MNALRPIILLLVFVSGIHADGMCAESVSDSLVLQRVMSYRESIAEPEDTIQTNIYVRYYFWVDKRNFSLMLIPTMYHISRGHRAFAGELLSDIYMKNNAVTKAERILNTGTIPHNKMAMSAFRKYLMPNLYNETILNKHLLSPFNRHNKRLYKYKVSLLTDNRAEIIFRPKIRNTQTISGSAIVDKETGRIIKTRFSGEYDMIGFHFDAEMGEEGVYSLFPKTTDVYTTFRFIGNRINTYYHSATNIPAHLPDTIRKSNDISLMESIRPDSLPERFKSVYAKYGQSKTKTDTVVAKKEKKRWDKVLWNILGDYGWNSMKGEFGTNNQGSFGISPILHPMYFSYNKRQGFIYKFTLRGRYNFSMNRNIELSFRAGYSFKQKQLYFRVPLRFNYNKKRNGYFEIEVGNGNRITNSSVVDQIKNETADSIDWDKLNLDYFRDFYMKITNNYDLSEKWSIQPGLVFHKRSAVDKRSFESMNRATKYFSFAPSMQVQFRPSGWKGPIITADYERGVKAGKAKMEYERLEFDFSWKKQYKSLRSLSMRLGSGFYTSKSKDSYFLDYVNFREENIPGGWNDDWTGEYLLLNSNWYNASEYYVRSNLTYESPLMLLSRLPYVGRIMEMERIYANVLFVEHLHPYIEYGYGFTNRFLSMGVFVATRNQHFEGFGCRFGFELFRNW